MFGKHNQILDVYEAVPKRSWGNVAECVFRVPVIEDYAHFGCVNNPVAVEINYWFHRYLS